MERLCKDCKHIYYWSSMMCCGKLIGTENPHDGRTLEDSDLFHVVQMRMTLCGWDDPKWWEPKPKETP